jgi:plasmid stabilization system protein ParE
MANRKISWDTQALQQFNAAINYIARDSLQGAEKVRKDILKKVDRLQMHPTLYNPDKYKKNNDGNFRAFELYHYRVSYYVSSIEIRILRVRHTSMEPKEY